MSFPITDIIIYPRKASSTFSLNVKVTNPLLLVQLEKCSLGYLGVISLKISGNLITILSLDFSLFLSKIL
ncbi:TPA: hypothetical protein I9009_002370 [Clostridium perfringens]|uniref:hypothetical protein n=1 Tax=Clostridium perfringens TaxID=1502 RepID=UPI001A300AEE|nr:hypothetical protein [Clostridium perfringens]